MAEGDRKNWSGLCDAGLEAKDPHELLKIVQELNEALKHEEQARRVPGGRAELSLPRRSDV